MGNGVITGRAPSQAGLFGRLARPKDIGRLDDRELVRRASERDGKAFGELYERYVEDVYLYLHLRVRDVQIAEDLTQDVFVNAFRGLSKFRWQGAFRPWLLRVAHNRLANHWRTLGRRPQLANLESDADDDARNGPQLAADTDLNEMISLQLDSERAVVAMESLTELQQQVLALRFGLELSVKESATAMHRSESAVKNLQYSALNKLRSALMPEEAGA